MDPFEPPKYIASLIAAINDGAKSAQLGALAFVAVGVFLLASTFATSDEDLLLNHSVAISQLGGVSVPVYIEFGLAPGIFLAAHVYTLLRYDMLAGNIRRFLIDLEAMVPLGTDRERCRQLLANVEFVQALVTPRGAPGASVVFRAVSWFLIAWYPLLVLLVVQTGSLRLQDWRITLIHHVCLGLDMLLLGWFGFFPRLQFGRSKAFGRITMTPWARQAGCGVMAIFLACDLLWLQVPEPEALTLVWMRDTANGQLATGWEVWRSYSRDSWKSYATSGYNSPALSSAWWLETALAQPVDLALCPVLHWGCRYLSIANRVLTLKVWDNAKFVALRANMPATPDRLAAVEPVRLAGRVLRFADLHGTEMLGADLRGIDLRHAHLIGADLREAQFDDVNTRLENANLTQARLAGAKLQGAQLAGALLSHAGLEGTDLSYAQLAGAQLTGAQLSGAILHSAHLVGADLSTAQLAAVDLHEAQLAGARLVSARLPGADLRSAGLWNVNADGAEVGLADLRRATAKPAVEHDELSALPPDTSDAIKTPIHDALQPHADAFSPLQHAETRTGGVLSSTSCHAPSDMLGLPCDRVEQNRNERDQALIERIAAENSAAAEGIARRLDLDLASVESQADLLLACRMLAANRGSSVELRPGTLERLRAEVGNRCTATERPAPVETPATNATRCSICHWLPLSCYAALACRAD